MLTTETPSMVAPRAAVADGPRVRLLKFVTIFEVGGTEGQVATIAEGLDPGRFDVRLAALLPGGALRARMERVTPDIADYRIPNLYGGRAIGQRLRFARYLRHQRIDIVHTYNFYPNAFALPAARLARVPVVLASIRDTGAYLTPLQRRVQRDVCCLADGVVVNADAIRRWLLDQGYDDRRITVIPNGVNLARFGRPGDGGRVRRDLGVPAGARLVAMVARLSRIKGVEYFLESAAAIAPGHPDVRFLVIGDASCNEPGYADEVRAYARRLGVADRVVFTGLSQDVPEVLSEVAVSVLPSLSEGLSNTVLESMAAGVPVVATRVGGTAEAVEDGVTGLLVPARDGDALTRAIVRVLDDRELAGRLGRAGRERAVDRFSTDAMIRATERLYTTLLDAKRRKRE